MVSSLIKEFNGGCSGSCGVYRVPLFIEILAQRIGHDWLVVYHKNSYLFVFHLFLLSGSCRSLRAHSSSLLRKKNVVLAPARGGELPGQRKLHYKTILRYFCRPAVRLYDLCRQRQPD